MNLETELQINIMLLGFDMFLMAILIRLIDKNYLV